MLEIVLLILKIAGIILAVILGILIAGVCSALFVPVRYRGDFSISDARDDGEKDIRAVFRASWFLRFIRAYVSLEEGLRVRVKVFFFTVMDTAEEKKEKKKKKKSRKNKTDKGKRSGEEEAEEGQADVRTEDGPKSGKGDVRIAEDIEDVPENGDTEAGNRSGESSGKERDNEEEESAPKEKPGIKKRISNILQTIRNFCDKLKQMRDKTEEIKELWNAGHMVRSRELLWRQLSYLLKHTKPKKLKGYLRFGFDDPSATGYAMAVYGILCAFWQPEISVEPDFEKEVLDCRIRIKGKIRAWHFVRAALRLLVSKDVRCVIKDVKKL